MRRRPSSCSSTSCSSSRSLGRPRSSTTRSPSARARGGHRLPAGVLRHLVGVDELHVVRVGLRQATTCRTACSRWCRSPACSSSPPGVPRAFDQRDFDVVLVGGYLVMRVALVACGCGPPATTRHRARRAAMRPGIDVHGGLGRGGASSARAGGWAFVVWSSAELAVPMWAERAARTPWHAAPHRRALRPLHDHRARRDHPRRQRRVPVTSTAGEPTPGPRSSRSAGC